MIIKGVTGKIISELTIFKAESTVNIFSHCCHLLRLPPVVDCCDGKEDGCSQAATKDHFNGIFIDVIFSYLQQREIDT